MEAPRSGLLFFSLERPHSLLVWYWAVERHFNIYCSALWPLGLFSKQTSDHCALWKHVISWEQRTNLLTNPNRASVNTSLGIYCTTCLLCFVTKGTLNLFRSLEKSVWQSDYLPFFWISTCCVSCRSTWRRCLLLCTACWRRRSSPFTSETPLVSTEAEVSHWTKVDSDWTLSLEPVPFHCT